MGSIVDRNPIAADAIRKKLNALVDHVRHALRSKEHREAFLNTFPTEPREKFEELRRRVENIAEKSDYLEDFFKEFAGQGRVRWHYGAAHPILSDVEDCYIADKGRNWLFFEQHARMDLVLGPVNDEGLVWFDVREFWQIGSAAVIVGASCGGAFILSFFTPTVGLGCRSGGYTIFFCIAFGLLIMEMLIWFVLSPYEVEKPEWYTNTSDRLRRIPTVELVDDFAHGTWERLKRRTSGLLNTTGDWLTQIVVKTILLLPWDDKEEMKVKTQRACDRVLDKIRAWTPQRRWEVFFFRPLEIFNTIWLIYIVLAQTFGWYKTCDCVTSYWGTGGGYLDFSQQDVTNNEWVMDYWVAGTCVSSIMMALAMFYITVEWAQQSWISAENYKDAMSGLRMTRRYRHWTFPFRWLSRKSIQLILDPIEKLGFLVGFLKKPQKTLFWTKEHEWGLQHPNRPETQSLPGPSSVGAGPAIELTEHYTPMARDGSHESHNYETPAMPTSLFPPAISTRRRPHNTYEAVIRSDSQRLSEDFTAAQRFLDRTSEESFTTPLIRWPGEAHHPNETERSRSKTSDEEQRRSSEDGGYALSPPATVHSSLGPFFGNDANIHNRQGYARANSEPGSPPAEGGLGILYSQRDVESTSSRQA